MHYSQWLLPEQITHYILGLDLAQTQDPTALAIVERTTYPRRGTVHYACRYLKRWPLGTGYRDIIGDVEKLIATPDSQGKTVLANACLVVDATGVGRSVVAMFWQAPTLVGRIAPVLITGSHAVTYDPAGMWHLPRKELVGVLQALMQTERLKIAAGLTQTQLLVQELQLFKAKITRADDDDLENWREREHDDLVLALAIALWYGEMHPLRFESDAPIVLVPA